MGPQGPSRVLAIVRWSASVSVHLTASRVRGASLATCSPSGVNGIEAEAAYQRADEAGIPRAARCLACSPSRAGRPRPRTRRTAGPMSAAIRLARSSSGCCSRRGRLGRGQGGVGAVRTSAVRASTELELPSLIARRDATGLGRLVLRPCDPGTRQPGDGRSGDGAGGDHWRCSWRIAPTQGLPFVPTKELRVDIADGSNLVAGNDVREGGFRIGLVSDLKPISARQWSGRGAVDVEARSEQREGAG